MNDVLIIGAGPAGLAAAINCARYGLVTTVVDEFIQPGGRLLGQLHQEPSGDWWNGIEETKKLVAETKKWPITLSCGISVYDIEKHADGQWIVFTNEGRMEATYLLIATGAAEYTIPVPGWTLPGVMSIGAAQVMTNVHRVEVGKKGIIIGANILAFAILNELQLAGITVDRVVLPMKSPISEKESNPLNVITTITKAGHLAPSPLLRMGSKLMKIERFKKIAMQYYPNKGLKMNGTSLQLRKAATEIVGDGQVEAVKLAKIDARGNIIANTEEVVAVDFVCIAGGLYPLAELAAVAGCPFVYLPELGGHVPIHGKSMETPLERLYVAGNITGIESGKIAMAQGKVAGLAIASKQVAQHDQISSVERELQAAITHVEELRKTSTIQFMEHIHIGREQMNGIWHRERTS